MNYHPSDNGGPLPILLSGQDQDSPVGSIAQRGRRPSMVRMSRTGRAVLIAVAVSLSFRAFQYFPGLGLLDELWMAIALVPLIGIYLPWRRRDCRGIEGFEIYLLLLMVLIPACSALCASFEFGQPLIYGLLAQREMLLVGGVPLLAYQALVTRRITFKDVELALVSMAWATLVGYTLMALFLEPSTYFATYGLGFVTNDDSLTSRFKFDPVFINFGFLYYALNGFRKKSFYNYVQCFPFLLFTVVVLQGRTLSLCLLGAYFILAIKWTRKKSRIPTVFAGLVLVVALILITIYFINQPFLMAFLGKFSDAFTVAFTGQYTDDPSANARIDETVLALPYILKNWLLGSGRLSNQWQGGFQSAIGYFYPDDIGIVGVIFMHGVLGTLFFCFQFIYAYLFTRILAKRGTTPLMDATKGFILFYGVRSIATAQFVFKQEALLFFVALLWVDWHVSTQVQGSSGRRG